MGEQLNRHSSVYRRLGVAAAAILVTFSVQLALGAAKTPVSRDADGYPPSFIASLRSGVQTHLQYPESSLAAGDEGRAVVAVTVDRKGVVRKAELQETSGFAALDAEAVAVVQRIGQFDELPPTFRPNSSTFTLPVPVAFVMAPPQGPGIRPIDGQPLEDVGAGIVVDPAVTPSLWLRARARRYGALMASSHCDVLVVPVQVEMAAFDRPSRQIMSAELAGALAPGAACVTDPQVVDVALGEGLRRRNSTEVLELAAAVQATTIVQPYVGHDDHGRMRITLQVMRRADGMFQKPVAHSFDGCRYADDSPSFVCFREQLPALLKRVGLEAGSRGEDRLGSLPHDVPPTPDVFLHPVSRDVLGDASDLMLLAMLAPAGESRAGERLFAKAWTRLEAASSDTAEVLRMRARIMFHLQQRPYALSLIAADASDEAEALRAVLNGHLPHARQGLARLKGDRDRLFLALEVHDLELRYRRGDRAAAESAEALMGDTPWAPLLQARIGDRDEWVVTDTIPLKQLLDKLYPIPGFDVSSEALAKSVVGGSNALEFRLQALRHVHRLLEQQPEKFCCQSFTGMMTALDLLDLLDNRIERALIGHARFQTSPQARYDIALAILDTYEAELGGNPDFEAARSDAYSRVLEGGQVQNRDLIVARRNTAARLATAWEQGQSLSSSLPLYELRKARLVGDSDPLGAYGLDFPIRNYWTDRYDAEERRLAFSPENVRPLSDLVEAGKDVKKWLAALGTRFVGSGSATQLRLKNADLSQRTPAVLRAQLAQDPDNWELHAGLAGALIRASAFQDVSEAVFSFSGFQNSKAAAKNGNTVTLANYAFDWGGELFWLGEFEAAKPLLRSAAGFDNGSAASVGAKTALALLDEDFGKAAGLILENARHYHDPRRYDDFLRLMFASGRRDQAWSMVDQVFSQFRADAVWNAVRVGNRLTGQDTPQLREWLAAHSSESRQRGTRDHLVRYAFMEHFLDRVPEPDTAAFLKEFAGTPEVVVDDHGFIFARGAPYKASSMLGPGVFGADRHAPLKPASQVPDRYVLLAEAMAPFRAGRFAEAATAFDRLSAFYDLKSDDLQFAWPYFAFAAAKSADTYKVEQYLATLSDADATSGIWLARAVFAALSDRGNDSQEALFEAFLKWDKHYRVVGLPSSYVFMDVCDLLYEAKPDTRYRDDALRVARALRVVQPTDAYAHAMIARLGTDHVERVKALAVALYLDPLSHWASDAPPELRQEADQWRKSHPLFEIKTNVPEI